MCKIMWIRKEKTYLIRLLATGFKLHKAAVRRLGQWLNFFELGQKAKALSRSKLVLLHWTHWSCANGKGITLIDILWGFGPISSPGWARFSVLKRTSLFHKWQRTVAYFFFTVDFKGYFKSEVFHFLRPGCGAICCCSELAWIHCICRADSCLWMLADTLPFLLEKSIFF